MFDLNNFIPYRLNQAAQQTSEALARKYRNQYGLTVPEWRVLAHLGKYDKLSVRDLEKAIGLDRVAASRAGTSLCSKGWVQKIANEQDRRLVEFSLTDVGREHYGKVVVLATSTEELLLKTLSKSDQKKLLELLCKVEEAARKIS
ncbi:MarR family winged helix-turn-helix transcriptional regulator [Marinomonas polaris]|jgi:DNA-binding MarR family transcriptional regulator|uniref:DNA-binding transcriptional regulator, MarR family n=1 Tax=Marinomonas polaris DSM 16579 TaxID=1122206 RepID=A0A1M5DV44_9GAMM|nr:MarR family winged helix-turn-helix transcriptional regulator [Marinomonas polaris]SHF70883.1 DNA-binding transcriptional regulator, MarR family [Marinomonas polaris DSM 16579]